MFINKYAMEDTWFGLDITIEDLIIMCDPIARMNTMQMIVAAIRRIDPSRKGKQIYIYFRSVPHSMHITDEIGKIIQGITGTTEIHLIENQFLQDNENEFSLRLPDFDIFIYGEHLTSKKLTKTFDGEKTKKQIAALKSQLENPAFTEKAPKNVVDGVRENLRKLEAMLN